MSNILKRPSIAVVAWAALVLALFVWRGDLGLHSEADETPVAESDADASGPVVVRRNDAPARLPRATRAGGAFDSMGFRLVGAEIVPTNGDSRRTASDGSFAVDLVRAEISDLLVRAQGYRSTWIRTTAVAPSPLYVQLEPAAPWDTEPQPPAPAPQLRGEGTVLGVAGDPLADAFVNVAGTQCWGQTDDIGRIELPLPSSSAVFVISRPATADAPAIAAVSDDFVSSRARGIVPLPPLTGAIGGAIRGIVRDPDGRGIAGLPVAVRGRVLHRYVATGAGGAFTAGGLMPDDYVVEPFASRGALGEPVHVRVDRAVVACDVQLQKVETRSLRVVDERGAAAAGAWVASRIHGQRRGVGRVDGAGLVSLPVSEASEFEVRTSGELLPCEVRGFEATAEPPTLTIAQP